MLEEEEKEEGIKIANSLKEVKELSESILGMNLVTPQTGQKEKVLKFISSKHVK